MNGIGEVNGGGTGGEVDHIAPGGKHKDLVVEHIHLQGVDVILRIGVLLALQQAADPFKALLLSAAGAPLLVFPMGGNAVFRRLVHFPGADLHLKGNALGADDRGVKALVHIGFGRRDIVLEPAGHQVKQVMNVTQNIVTIGNGIHNDPERIQVVQFLYGFVLVLHFPVDGVHMLDAAVNAAVNAHRRQAGGNPGLDALHKCRILFFMGLEIVHNPVIPLRV